MPDRTHPSFLRLKRNWTKLTSLEKRKLINEIVGTGAGQRTLARLLKRDEDTIRYYSRMVKSHAEEQVMALTATKSSQTELSFISGRAREEASSSLSSALALA